MLHRVGRVNAGFLDTLLSLCVVEFLETLPLLMTPPLSVSSAEFTVGPPCCVQSAGETPPN